MANLMASSIDALIPLIGGVVASVLAFRKAGANEPVRLVKAKAMLRWLGPVLIVFSFVLFVIDRKAPPPNTSAPSTLSAQDLASVVQEIKERLQLPKQIDADTRLDDVRVSSANVIGYFATLVTMSKAQFDANPQAQQIAQSLRTTSCTNPKYIAMLKSGIGLHVSYQTSDHIEVIVFDVAPKDCGY